MNLVELRELLRLLRVELLDFECDFSGGMREIIRKEVLKRRIETESGTWHKLKYSINFT